MIVRAIEEAKQLIAEALHQGGVLDSDADAQELKGYTIGQYLRYMFGDDTPSHAELLQELVRRIFSAASRLVV